MSVFTDGNGGGAIEMLLLVVTAVVVTVNASPIPPFVCSNLVCPTGYTCRQDNVGTGVYCLNTTTTRACNKHHCPVGFVCTTNFNGTQPSCVSKTLNTLAACANVVCTMGFVCATNKARTEATCLRRVDPCRNWFCNNGKCETNGTVATCICNAGYAGFNCQTRVPANSCQNMNCNKGYCQSNGLTDRCVCNPGFTGEHCESREDKDLCASHLCGPGLVCVIIYDDIISPMCVPPNTRSAVVLDVCNGLECPSGYVCKMNLAASGPMCSQGSVTGVCADVPCGIGSVCRTFGGTIPYCVLTTASFIRPDTCATLVCPTGFECRAPSSRAGRAYCARIGSVIPRVCVGVTCPPTTTCVPNTSGTGPICKLSLCQAWNPCNGGYCVDTPISYFCYCPDTDSTGATCATRL